jgi:DNA-binding NarL/FixJ family response regulator
VATILVCDGSPLVREQLRRAIGGVRGVERVVTAATEDEAVEHIRAAPPDLVLLDVALTVRGGAGAVRRIRAADPAARVLVLTRAEDPDSVIVAAVAAGARGYLRKDASRAEVRVAVGQALTEPQANPTAPSVTPAAADAGARTLTERELEVLGGMCEGRSNAEIGKALFLSEDTVKTHARRLFRKLGATDRAHAVAIALRRGLVR